MKSLGITLREAREMVPFTLRQVEDVTGISNAYLSQLENDKIKKPSANVLYKLASAYKIELNELLIASGIIDQAGEIAVQAEKPASAWLKKMAVYASDMTADQQNEVLEFMKYMKFKNKNN